MVAFDSHIDRAFAQSGDLAAFLARGADLVVPEQPLPAPAIQAADEPPPGGSQDPGLAAQRRRAIHRTLVAEQQPVGLLEETLVTQLADQMAALEEFAAARQAAVRLGTKVLGEFSPFGDQQALQRAPTSSDPGDDASAASPASEQVFVNVMTSPVVTGLDRRLERAQRQVLKISKQLGWLQERRHTRDLPRLAAFAGVTIDLDSRPEGRPATPPSEPASESRDLEAAGDYGGRWATAETEADCERIFRNWIRAAGLACPQCGSREPAKELSNRRVLQCRCGCQRGLRHGTVLAHSNVSFLATFRAVRLLAHSPRVSCGTFRRRVGLSARAVQGFRSRILAALADPTHRGSLLAACGWQPEQVPST